jgi:hypothetical protein
VFSRSRCFADHGVFADHNESVVIQIEIDRRADFAACGRLETDGRRSAQIRLGFLRIRRGAGGRY